MAAQRKGRAAGSSAKAPVRVAAGTKRKAEEAERALKETEEVVRLMQQQMQDLQAGKDVPTKSLDRALTPVPIRSLRLLSSHIPYQEFLAFVAQEMI